MIIEKKCKHENAYYFHENAPAYCPDCEEYIDGGHTMKELSELKNNKETDERI